MNENQARPPRGLRWRSSTRFILATVTVGMLALLLPAFFFLANIDYP